MKTPIVKLVAAFWTIAFGMALPFATRGSSPVQWTVESGGNGHYYQTFSAPNGISWREASTAAVSLGGYLATVTSAEENDFIYSLVSADDSLWDNDGAGHRIGPWLGGLQPAGSAEPSGGWKWVTGEAFGYTAWATFEPTDGDGIEDRISYFAFNGVKDKTWNDYPADPVAATRPPVLGYIVEWPVSPSSGSQPGIAVYKIAASYTRMGDDMVRQVAVSGYMLMDLSTKNIVVLRIDPAKKMFRESTPEVSVANVNVKAEQTVTAIKFNSGDLSNALAKGSIGNGNVARIFDSARHTVNTAIPSEFTVNGLDLITSKTGQPVIRDYRGAIVLDRVSTAAANKNGYDIVTYSSMLQSDLVNKGYTANP
jgi:hypothetical protein